MSKDRIPSARLGTSQRGDIVSREEIEKPGPGSYPEGKKFGEGIPTYSIRGKPNDQRPNDVPGPGQYNDKSDAIKYQSPSYK